LQRQRAPDRLILPHPRMQDRAFVLIPLAEVAPDWRHPLLGLTVVQMRDALPPGAAGGIAAL
jgi:2-amino-4-hydroxy-6-hydroxymethyldihydropteridine diphosphokinase